MGPTVGNVPYGLERPAREQLVDQAYKASFISTMCIDVFEILFGRRKETKTTRATKSLGARSTNTIHSIK